VIGAIFVAILCLCGPINVPATATEQAVRVNPPDPPPEWPVIPPVPTGIWGLPFAPGGLSNCQEARFYANQFSLPLAFDSIIWRESNCRQELGVHTSCCWGYLQLDISLHLSDHRIGWRYRQNCGVHARTDADGPEPIEKQKHMCAAKQLYDVMGYSPW
jgi:hypothetical protein